MILALKNAGDARDTGLIPGQEDPPEEGMAIHTRILVWSFCSVCILVETPQGFLFESFIEI